MDKEQIFGVSEKDLTGEDEKQGEEIGGKVTNVIGVSLPTPISKATFKIIIFN